MTGKRIFQEWLLQDLKPRPGSLRYEYLSPKSKSWLKKIPLGGLNKSPTPSYLEKVPDEGTATILEQEMEKQRYFYKPGHMKM